MSKVPIGPVVAREVPQQGRQYSEVSLWRHVSPEDWNDWRWQIRNSIRTLDELQEVINLTTDEREGYLSTRRDFAMSIPPYYAVLMDPDDPWCPVRMQAVPRSEEAVGTGYHDSLGEEGHKVAPGLVHRYPDRVLLLVTNMCQLYCRHCTRKRLTGKQNQVLPKADLEEAFAYLRTHPEVRDVLISGGDPLTLSDKNLEYILSRLRAIPSIEIVRIGSRAPVTLPQRITPDLVDMLRRYHPLWMNTHFNHPKEITPEAVQACARIVDAGIPLGNQTVLLRGVNSSPRIMLELVRSLVKARVRPYYVYVCDQEQGLEHFRTTIDTAIEVSESLRGWTSGLAVPQVVVDAPGGGGKIPVAPSYVLSQGESRVLLRNFEGRTLAYPQPVDRDPTCPYDSKWAPAMEPVPPSEPRRRRLHVVSTSCGEDGSE
jgi:lysine 2,3-aminomutase